ncbi:MAG: hypothetical protein AB8G18_17630 [Gammaproteobacteria bacterium]
MSHYAKSLSVTAILLAQINQHLAKVADVYPNTTQLVANAGQIVADGDGDGVVSFVDIAVLPGLIMAPPGSSGSLETCS